MLLLLLVAVVDDERLLVQLPPAAAQALPGRGGRGAPALLLREGRAGQVLRGRGSGQEIAMGAQEKKSGFIRKNEKLYSRQKRV